jgi:Ca2+-binding EF-hand superfamily protein
MTQVDEPRMGVLFLAWTLALMVSSVAVPAGAEGPATGLEQLHAHADRNADGKIDRHEFHQHQVDLFYFLDVNKNGSLAASELEMTGVEHFVRVDLDKNGELAMKEFLEARSWDFEKADADNDGSLTVLEIRSYQSSE